MPVAVAKKKKNPTADVGPVRTHTDAEGAPLPSVSVVEAASSSASLRIQSIPESKIQRNVLVSLDSLKPDPANPYLHPEKNLKAIRNGLSFGQLQDIVVRKADNQIIAGNGRWSVLRDSGDKKVRVTYVDCDEHTARALSIIMNRSDENREQNFMTLGPQLAALANSHPELADATGFTERERERIMALAWDDARKTGANTDDYIVEKDEDFLYDAPAKLDGIKTFKENPVFESSSAWGIPDLQKNMIAEIPKSIDLYMVGRYEPPTDYRLVIYGSTSTAKIDIKRSVIAFYTYDETFENAWTEPADFAIRLVNRAPYAVIAPNFSLYDSMPAAEQMWQAYRSRWVARYWQEAGIKIIPDLELGSPVLHEILCSTIPKGSPISFQLSASKKRGIMAKLIQDAWMTAVKIIQPEQVLLYGGLDHMEFVEGVFPKSIEVIMTRDYADTVHDVTRSPKRNKQSKKG